jgi:hypothetical protein
MWSIMGLNFILFFISTGNTNLSTCHYHRVSVGAMSPISRWFSYQLGTVDLASHLTASISGSAFVYAEIQQSTSTERTSIVCAIVSHPLHGDRL